MLAGRGAALVVLLGLALASCGDKGTAPKPAELAGTWTATKAEYVSRTTPPETVDLVGDLGGTVTLTLTEAQAFTYIEAVPGAEPDTVTGTWRVEGDVGDQLSLSPAGVPWSIMFDMYFSGNTLRLTDGDVEYDFDEDGTPDAADLFLYLSR